MAYLILATFETKLPINLEYFSILSHLTLTSEIKLPIYLKDFSIVGLHLDAVSLEAGVAGLGLHPGELARGRGQVGGAEALDSARLSESNVHNGGSAKRNSSLGILKNIDVALLSRVALNYFISLIK